MGKLIVLEGLDGSGKATQAGLLLQGLVDEGRIARKVSFPDYDSNSSALVKMYLGGAFGTQPQDVNAYAASAFYAVDRYASYKTDWGSAYHQEGIVIADRYTTSNLIHQATKLPQEEAHAFVNWLEDFEYVKMGIPRPDAVVYLEVEPAVSQRLLAQRYSADENKKDIHERNVQYLESCHKAAMWCVKKLGWHKVQCSAEGNMRPREAIAADIATVVRRYL